MLGNFLQMTKRSNKRFKIIKIYLMISLLFFEGLKTKVQTSINIFWSFRSLFRISLCLYSFFFRLYYMKRADKIFINVHYCPPVLKHTAIIWGRKNCNELSFSEKLISLFYNLNECIATWCERQIKSRSLSFKKLVKTSVPKR